MKSCGGDALQRVQMVFLESVATLVYPLDLAPDEELSLRTSARAGSDAYPSWPCNDQPNGFRVASVARWVEVQGRWRPHLVVCLACRKRAGNEGGRFMVEGSAWRPSAASLRRAPRRAVTALGVLRLGGAGFGAVVMRLRVVVGASVGCVTLSLCVAGAAVAATPGWAIQPLRGPALPSSVLIAVSCTSATACTAVGSGNTRVLVERWNGETWSVQPTPKPAGSSDSVLMGVSCTSATACTAVGFLVSR
jgi:hypothetical protein